MYVVWLPPVYQRGQNPWHFHRKLDSEDGGEWSRYLHVRKAQLLSIESPD